MRLRVKVKVKVNVNVKVSEIESEREIPNIILVNLNEIHQRLGHSLAGMTKTTTNLP